MVNDDTNWARESLDQNTKTSTQSHSSVCGSRVTSEVNPEDDKQTVTESQVTTTSLANSLAEVLINKRMTSTDSSKDQDQQQKSSSTISPQEEESIVSNVPMSASSTSVQKQSQIRAKSHSSCSSTSSGSRGSGGGGISYPKPVILEEYSNLATTTTCSSLTEQTINSNNQSMSLSPPPNSSSQQSPGKAGKSNSNNHDDNSSTLKPSSSFKSTGSNKSGTSSKSIKFGKKDKKKKKSNETSSSGSSSLNCSSASIARLTGTDGQPLDTSGQSPKQLVSNSTSIISSATSTSSTRKYSRSHQRRFHRRFPAVDPDEMLIDWFNCALIADILLQGYLYISDNYFSFYSNIFGYKTQLLVPISDVVSVSKEKTAKIFPNAVGICTEEAKYVFGSLISRESTYKLLYDTWTSFGNQLNSIPNFDPRIDSLEDSLGTLVIPSAASGTKQHHLSVTGTETVRRKRKTSPRKDRPMVNCGDSNNESIANNSNAETTANESIAGSTVGIGTSADGSSEGSGSRGDLDSTASAAGLFIGTHVSGIPTLGRRKRLANFVTTKIKSGYSMVSSPRSWNGEALLLIGTVALVLLFLSTAFLMYRVRRVQSRLEDISGIDLDSSLSGLNPFSPPSGSFEGGSFAQEVKRVSTKLQSKLKEVTALRESLEGLLATMVEVPSELGH